MHTHQGNGHCTETASAYRSKVVLSAQIYQGGLYIIRHLLNCNFDLGHLDYASATQLLVDVSSVGNFCRVKPAWFGAL